MKRCSLLVLALGLLGVTVAVALAQITLSGDSFEQLAGNNVDFIAVLECRIFEIRMNCDTQIRRQRPGRRGPDQNEDFAVRKYRIDQGRIAR